jgi:ATP-dependent Lhr-like helicase
MTAAAPATDVLAQHTVAACALEPLSADAWFDSVRRSAPFATLPRSAFEATLEGEALPELDQEFLKNKQTA